MRVRKYEIKRLYFQYIETFHYIFLSFQSHILKLFFKYLIISTGVLTFPNSEIK